jgi:hypothetical protein
MAIALARRTPKIATDLDLEHKNALLKFAGLLGSPSVDACDNETFASIVSHAITYHGLSPAELADRFGVNKGTISRWSAGRNAPQPFARPMVVEWIREWAVAQADAITARERAAPQVPQEDVRRLRSAPVPTTA